MTKNGVKIIYKGSEPCFEGGPISRVGHKLKLKFGQRDIDGYAIPELIYIFDLVQSRSGWNVKMTVEKSFTDKEPAFINQLPIVSGLVEKINKAVRYTEKFDLSTYIQFWETIDVDFSTSVITDDLRNMLTVEEEKL